MLTHMFDVMAPSFEVHSPALPAGEREPAAGMNSSMAVLCKQSSTLASGCRCRSEKNRRKH